jgi:hypothetical protein
MITFYWWLSRRTRFRWVTDWCYRRLEASGEFYP